jgi:hypothetical protein
MKLLPVCLLIFIFACESASRYPPGGYEYPESVPDTDTNFYSYPVRDLFSRRDSFRTSGEYVFYRLFDEPNLSIRPMKKEVFRLTYSNAFGESLIIILTDGLLVSKEGNPGGVIDDDTSRLSALEQDHLNLLNRRYPIDTIGKHPWVKRYLDSMIKLYPQLLDVRYYYALIDKSYVIHSGEFSYKASRVHLSHEEYNALVNEINASGFWTMPFQIPCKYPPMDGDGFTLEANTRQKYNIVNVYGCPGDTSKLAKACQRLIAKAKLQDKVNLVRDEGIDTVKESDLVH